MIEYRPFLNTDPPQLVDMWRAVRPNRMLIQSVSVDVLERHVFSKPYFDRQGLILAVDGDQPRGFIHIGFGPNEHRTGLDRSRGLICLLLSLANDQRDEIAKSLIAKGEAYLRQQGATSVQVAGGAQLNPFYLGLYGGCRGPGIAQSELEMVELFEASGYEQQTTVRVLHRVLSGFRPVVDREQMKIRRMFHIEAQLTPPIKNWFDACMYGEMNRSGFVLTPRQGGDPAAQLCYWDIEPLSRSWGVHSSGLIDFEVNQDANQTEIGIFLLGEAMRQMQSQGIAMLEIQVEETDQQLTEISDRLGFELIETGTVYEKRL